MASLEPRTLKNGTQRIIVRWREAGRGSRYRSKSFPAGAQGRRDAKFFAATVERSKQLGHLADELVGSDQTVNDFIREWWRRYATTRLKPNTLTSYEYVLDKWVVSYLGELRLRDVSREVLDEWMAAMRRDGAGAPTVNRALAIVQGVLRRAVEWRRIPANPATSVRKLKHARSAEINARTPEQVETIRARLGRQDAALVSVLAYVGVRPAEAFALKWRDVLDDNGRPRARLWAAGTKTDAARRQPEVPPIIRRELLELHIAAGRPALDRLVFPNADGGELTRQNWRARVWKPALAKKPAVSYFRPYDLRHTCATLLIYEGRIPNEVAAQIGHSDPGFTLRKYTHVFADATKRRRVPINDAIMAARQTTSQSVTAR